LPRSVSLIGFVLLVKVALITDLKFFVYCQHAKLFERIPAINHRVFFSFFQIFSFLGFVFVSGDTEMAANAS